MVTLENIKQLDQKAKIVINEKTGTVVAEIMLHLNL